MPSFPTAEQRARFMDAMEFRHSCKTFDPRREIPDEDFAFLLEVARLSPSSFGFEPWRLVSVQDRPLRERMREVSWGAQGQLPTASRFLAITVQRGQELTFGDGYIGRLLRDTRELPPERIEGSKARFGSFASDDFRLDTPERLTEWAARQAYIVLANLMTAAAFIGIDTCPIEGFHQEKLESVLDGHGGYDRATQAVVCMLAFGFRVNEQKPRLRRPISDCVGWA